MKQRDMIMLAVAAIGAYFLFFRRTPAPPPVSGAVGGVSTIDYKRIDARYDR